LPAEIGRRITAAWGDPENDPDFRDGAFRFRAGRFGNILVALPPERGNVHERRASYHDPALPPRHALIAFGLWLRHSFKADLLLHMGAHGTLEWLPGKAVALTGACFPEAVVGPLPVIYPFIVSNPGEAAQAKRRIAAVTIGHLPPPLTEGSLSGAARELERLVDEYAIADGLDRRRRERLAKLIIDTARDSGLAREAGAERDLHPDEALRKIDAWLCDLKDLAIKDGLHVYGRIFAETTDPQWQASADAEREALITALDGKRVAPGPAGSPQRGRRDVVPTGRNLFTADPRLLPTPTAMELGRLAAGEVIRLYLQTHGEMPRALVIDLWGSATLRTGGEEIAQGLALMGCRPVWDGATGRVTGIEVLPCAAMGRPRVDVTWRISGLFRDLFRRRSRCSMPRRGSLPNARRTATRILSLLQPASLAAAGSTASSATLQAPTARAPKTCWAATQMRPISAQPISPLPPTAYGGAEGEGRPDVGFAKQVASADLLLHPSNDPTRDLLEGAEDVAHIGGFAAAASLLGRAPDFVVLDTTNPGQPRARTLPQALARIVRGRATNPLFIEGMMRHGARGAAELAETVDRLVDFAETTGAVSSALFDLVHETYLADPEIREFLLRENPDAAQAIAERLEGARRKGLWHPRRNDIALTKMHAEASA
jgi:cobaltochelatase CobN